jgi:hypothetical protein
VAAPVAAPALVDQSGRPLPADVSQAVGEVYRDLHAVDVAGIARVYASNAATPWPTTAARLADPVARAGLLRALRTAPQHSQGYTYTAGAYRLEFNASPAALRTVAVPRQEPRSTTPRAAATGCPSATALATVFREQNATYGTGARPTSPVTCAGRFAIMRLTSPSTPDGLSTIYAIGPPTRFLAAGTGPICTDDASQGGAVVVPHKIAATLHCITSSAAPVNGATPGSNRYPDPSSAAAHAGNNPYRCNDTGISADDPCSFHWPEGVGDGPQTIGQKWEACHWADDKARGQQYCKNLPAQYR